MRNPLRWTALFCTLACACGCGDSPRVLDRDMICLRNEFVDALLKVTDEASAKKVYEEDIKKLQKKYDDGGVRKRMEEWQTKINSQEKSLKNASRNAPLKAGQESDAMRSANPEFFEAQDAAEDYANEIKATSVRLDRQLKRIGAIFDQVRTGSKDNGKPLTDVLMAATVFATRVSGGNDVDWGPPLRVMTVAIKVVPLYKHKGAAKE
jgi:hypothetical protein